MDEGEAVWTTLRPQRRHVANPNELILPHERLAIDVSKVACGH
jgi:hypothetical protein